MDSGSNNENARTKEVNSYIKHEWQVMYAKSVESAKEPTKVYHQYLYEVRRKSVGPGRSFDPVSE